MNRIVKWAKQLFRSGKAQPSRGAGSEPFIIQPKYGDRVGTPADALRIDTVYRCVDILSGTIASLQLQLLRRSGSVFEYDEDSHLNYLFSRRANERQSFFVLMQNAIISLLLRGNASFCTILVQLISHLHTLCDTYNTQQGVILRFLFLSIGIYTIIKCS